MNMNMVYGNLVCGLKLSDRFACVGFFPDGYGREAITYALTRFFRKNACAREKLVTQSWKMRFAKGKGRRPCNITLTIPAAALELPCGTAQIRLTVDANGIEIRHFLLLDSASRRTDPFVWA